MESVVSDKLIKEIDKWKNTTKARIISILIDIGTYNSDASLKEFSNQVIKLSSIDENSDAVNDQVSSLFSMI